LGHGFFNAFLELDAVLAESAHEVGEPLGLLRRIAEVSFSNLFALLDGSSCVGLDLPEVFGGREGDQSRGGERVIRELRAI
jgi:hypothetical protein